MFRKLPGYPVKLMKLWHSIVYAWSMKTMIPWLFYVGKLDKVLPDAKVIMNKTIAHAREKQRLMMERYAAFAMPFVMVVCAVWIGVLFMLNVRERKTEIGVLHAVGFSGFKVFFTICSKGRPHWYHRSDFGIFSRQCFGNGIWP